MTESTQQPAPGMGSRRVAGQVIQVYGEEKLCGDPLHIECHLPAIMVFRDIPLEAHTPGEVQELWLCAQHWHALERMPVPIGRYEVNQEIRYRFREHPDYPESTYTSTIFAVNRRDDGEILYLVARPYFGLFVPHSAVLGKVRHVVITDLGDVE